jgi:NhaP-type Na+/H+ or K+/H+ antiporter
MSKIIRRLKLLVAVVLVLGTPAGFVVGYYLHYHLLAVQLINERHMDTERANAVKHAFAAAQLYEAFDSIGFDAQTSQRLVLNCGKMNEYAEHFLRAKNKRDSNAEMMKDLLNNFIGVAVAKKYALHTEHISLFDELVVLAKKNVLIASASVVPQLSPDQPALMAKGSNVPHVMGWFAAVQSTLTTFVDKALVSALDERPTRLTSPEVEIEKAQVE